MAYDKPDKTKTLTKAFEQRALTKRNKNSKKRLRTKLAKSKRGMTADISVSLPSISYDADMLDRQVVPPTQSRRRGSPSTAMVTERAPQAEEWHERDSRREFQSLDKSP